MPAPPVKLGNVAWGEDTYLGSSNIYILGWDVPHEQVSADNILCSSYNKAVLVSGILADEVSVPGEIMEVYDIAADGTCYYKTVNEVNRASSCIVLLNNFEYGHAYKVYHAFDRIVVAHLPRGAVFHAWLDHEQSAVVGSFLYAASSGGLRVYAGETIAECGMDQLLGISLSSADTVGIEERKLIKVCVA